MNPSTLPVADRGVRFGEQVVPVARGALGRADAAEVVLGVRPEDLELDAAGLPVEVDVVRVSPRPGSVHLIRVADAGVRVPVGG